MTKVLSFCKKDHHYLISCPSKEKLFFVRNHNSWKFFFSFFKVFHLVLKYFLCILEIIFFISSFSLFTGFFTVLHKWSADLRSVQRKNHCFSTKILVTSPFSDITITQMLSIWRPSHLYHFLASMLSLQMLLHCGWRHCLNPVEKCWRRRWLYLFLCLLFHDISSRHTYGYLSEAQNL